MNTSLISVEVEAFKNFVRPTTLSLADLPSGLYLVRGVNYVNDRLGSNGSGKTTLFSDAVAWCLYGRTVGGLRTTDVLSWLTKAPPRVAVTMSRGGVEHVVQRGPRATDLTVDGRQVGQGDVDALVGLGSAAFAQAVVWGQAQPLFFDLPPSAKMELLQDALGLERWERYAEAAAARERRVRASLTVLEGDIRGLETARTHAEVALAEAREAAGRWGREHAAELTSLQAAVREAAARHAAAEKRRDDAHLATDSAGTQASLLRPQVDELRTQLADQDKTEAGLAATLLSAEAEVEVLKKQHHSLTVANKCPTCGQVVTKRDAAHHGHELGTRVDEVGLRVERTRAKLIKANKTANNLRATLERATNHLREFTEESDRHAAALRNYEREESAARVRRIAAEDAMRAAEAATNPHREAAAQARKRLVELAAQAREAGDHATKLEASAERAQFWARGFRDIRLTIVDEVLDDLQGTTAAVLEDLGLGEWSVDYATERETKSGTTQRALTVAIRAPANEGSVRWEVYSGGERQRLRLAGALALGEVLLSHAGVSMDFRVLDEPTRGLSREGVRDLCEMLRLYAEDAGLRLFFIDHLALDGGNFSGIMTIENHRGGARVVW